MNRKWLSGIGFAACFLALQPVTRAEDNGEELAEMMSHPSGREVAQYFIDDVWQRWDQKVFCMPEGDRHSLSYDAVKSYLDANPGELFRPRRYLIVQGLRERFPCEGR